MVGGERGKDLRLLTGALLSKVMVSGLSKLVPKIGDQTSSNHVVI